MKRIGLLCLAAACGSSSSKQPDAAVHVDAPPDVAVDAPTDVPEGVGGHYHYVVDHMTWPTTTSEARADAFDLDGDGAAENELGMVMATFSSMGFDAQPATNTGIANATTITLADLQAMDLTTELNAGFMLYIGVNPVPPACSGSGDTVCGHHLTGTGSFGISPNDLRDPLIPGAIANGTFTGGPGHMTVPLYVLGGFPASIRLLAAHAQFTPTFGGLTGTIGGAISLNDRDFVLYPSMTESAIGIVARDCTSLQNPPGCGCANQSQGASVISLFDANQDCSITVDELKNNSLIMALFAPDVTVENQQAVSVGFAFTAVSATFTP